MDSQNHSNAQARDDQSNELNSSDGGTEILTIQEKEKRKFSTSTVPKLSSVFWVFSIFTFLRFQLEKYDIPEEAKQWIFYSICTAWRKYKSQLKKKHFEAYENDDLRMENRPIDVQVSHFKDLLEY
ncbi:uncharacterized protein [Nicotiana tomentosiformis]|uniref:uncharacterized protein isoform X1 n=1 Tax=Nicotiana tomentosiformis TaxID=4098 RepID=UPI00388C4B54